jgi:ABC-type Mn2+/Zn2+ transport system permease subunit
MTKLTPEERLANKRLAALFVIGLVFWIVCAILLVVVITYLETNSDNMGEVSIAIVFGTLVLSVIVSSAGAFDGITHYIFPDVSLIPSTTNSPIPRIVV